VAEVCAQARALLEPTALAGAPVVPVSAQSGDGLEALRGLLFDAAREADGRPVGDAAFRLAIDRSFTLDGIGTVATGTVHAGRVSVGDGLEVVPGARPVRVRSLHAQNRAVQSAHAGQRCAVGLAGLARDELERGQWLVAPEAALASDRIDATLTLWHAEARPLRSGTPVHVHLGAAAVPGTVVILDGDVLAPGASARAQLVLRRPVGAWHGDRVVLRDASASRTMAGGAVLDPFAPVRYRRTPQRFAELDALALPDAAARLEALLEVAPHGVDLRRFAAAQGVSLPPLPSGLVRHSDASGDWALGAAHARAARSRALDALSAFHERQPTELGPDSARLRRLAVPRLPEPLWRALLAQMQAEGAVAVRGAFVHLPEHGVRLSATEERIAQKVAPMLADAGFDGAWVRDLARDAGEPEPLLRVTMARLAQRGELHQVVKDLYYPVSTATRLAAIARAVAADCGGEVTAARFRDATRLGRKRAIQVLEYFDRIGMLRRIGDVHRVRTDSGLFDEAAQ
jgi:selenocysteine-specific elongation factor